MKHPTVTKAVLPVAGLGTRFLPATKAQPKEMLPIIDKPIVQYMVEDMVRAGIEDIIFVTSNGKRALEDHFDRNFELEYRLEQKGMKKELEEIAQIGKLANFAFVRQPKPLGDGHAVLQALPFIDDDEAVMIMFADDLVVDIAPQLVAAYAKHHRPILSALEVPREAVSRYGIMSGSPAGEGLFEVNGWVEKPAAKDAPSNLAWPGPAILTPEILQRLRTTKPGKDGEIRLADAFQEYFKDGGTMLASIITTPRFDCGNKLEYVKAQMHFGLQRDEFRDELLAFMRNLLSS